MCFAMCATCTLLADVCSADCDRVQCRLILSLEGRGAGCLPTELITRECKYVRAPWMRCSTAAFDGLPRSQSVSSSCIDDLRSVRPYLQLLSWVSCFLDTCSIVQLRVHQPQWVAAVAAAQRLGQAWLRRSPPALQSVGLLVVRTGNDSYPVLCACCRHSDDVIPTVLPSLSLSAAHVTVVCQRWS